MSGRRVLPLSVTVNWLMADHLLASGSSKSMARAWAPRKGAAGGAVLHGHPVPEHAVKGAVARLQRGPGRSASSSASSVVSL